MPRTYSTLQGIPLFQSGVGDGDQLQVQLREGLDGGWYARYRTGWFYLGTEEEYLYAEKGEGTLTGTARTSGCVSFTVSGDVTDYGPIRVKSLETNAQLQRVSSPLRCYRELTFSAISSGNTELRSATLPSSGLLVQLCTHPVTGIYLSVPATGDIQNRDQYVYHPQSAKIYIRDTNPPTLYATYIVGETDPSQLRQEEILVVDRDGYLRTQLSPVASGGLYAATVRRPSPTGTVSVSAMVVSGNLLTATGLSTGDVVAVDYWVYNSFHAYVSGGTTLVVRTLPAASGSHAVTWEAGDGEYYDTTKLPVGHPDRINLNPLIYARRSGFLQIVDSDTPQANPAQIELQLSEHNVVYDSRLVATLTPSNTGSAWWTRMPHTYLTATVRDGEGQPLTDITPVITQTGSATGVMGHLVLIKSNRGQSDGRGELTWVFMPVVTGSVTLTVTASGFPSASGEISLRVWGRERYQRPEEYMLGKLLLQMEEEPYTDRTGELKPGRYRASAYYCYPDGAPFQPQRLDYTSGAVVSPWAGSVIFSTSRSKMYYLDGTPYNGEVGVSLDPTAVASILVEPIPGDVLRATVETPVEGSNSQPRRRTAAPLRFSPAPSN